ncbi:MAG: hypothetical protein LIO86_12125 [Lachnospiraceae bacterium]|nr:hypothetical protein [Lachnospiraceae bacterium]
MNEEIMINDHINKKNLRDLKENGIPYRFYEKDITKIVYYDKEDYDEAMEIIEQERNVTRLLTNDPDSYYGRVTENDVCENICDLGEDLTDFVEDFFNRRKTATILFRLALLFGNIMFVMFCLRMHRISIVIFAGTVLLLNSIIVLLFSDYLLAIDRKISGQFTDYVSWEVDNVNALLKHMKDTYIRPTTDSSVGESSE